MQDTLVAVGSHQASTLSWLTFKHLSHCDTKSCIPAHKTLVSNVCSQNMTACLMLASAANRTPARCFLRCPMTCKSLGPILPIRLVTGYGPPAQQSPSHTQWLQCLKTPYAAPAWQAICIRHYVKWAVISWLQALDIVSVPGYKPWCHDGINGYILRLITWMSDAYLPLPLCHAYITVRINFFVSACFDASIF